MDHLPIDPHILVSSINMLLRDEEYDSLDEICYAYNCDKQPMLRQLLLAGYVYSPEQRQIRPIGYDQ